MPVVVKADGLAAGKGVVVCASRDEAVEAVEQIARQKVFGAAGDRLVIEERLDGQEASVLAITDGQTIVTLPAGPGPQAGLRRRHRPEHRRHGRLLPGPAGRRRDAALDRGARPGADGPRHEACAAAVPRRALRRADDHQPGPEGAGIQRPLRRSRVPAAADAAEDRPARRAGGDGRRPARPDRAAGVGPAAGGLRGDGQPRAIPGDYAKGHPIRGLDDADALPDVKVFHAGTALNDGQVVTAGGRVLGVTALGDNIAKAKLNAYRAVKCIRWAGAWCRKDISDKALAYSG